MPPMIGQISFFPYVFAPKGWRFCDGSQLSISEHETLFMVLGFKFGGDGENTFALPDLRKAAASNTHYCISMHGIYKPPYYDEGLLGETMLAFAEPSARNVLDCTGQMLRGNQNPSLKRYLGNRFGGDGVNSYALPDLRSKAPGGFLYQMCVEGGDPMFPNERTPYVGELVLLPFEIQSERWWLCDGAKIPIPKNPALYSLLGDQFGGDSASFLLPDLRNAAPEKFNYYISPTGVFPTRP